MIPFGSLWNIEIDASVDIYDAECLRLCNEDGDWGDAILYLLPLDQQLVLPIALAHQHNGSYASRPLDDQDGVRFVLTDKPIEEGVAAATLIGDTTLKW